MQPVYEIRNLAYATPEGRVLQSGLSFEVLPGQLLLITGSNGCGKTTLLKTLLGEFPALRGSVHSRVRPSRIEYIPQLENTEIHLPVTLGDILAMSQERQVDWDEIAELGLLRRTHLDIAWNTASGGERKRALLTRALLRKPQLLVFDEPMNHLDEASRKMMASVMARFLSEDAAGERAIVMVCHQGLLKHEEPLFDLLRLNLDARCPEVTA